MRNIVLIGFMGTGKTVIAKMLAHELDGKYVSTDDLIEKKEKRNINDIFRDSGETYFRKIEKEIIKEISSQKGQVIDAGGGAVLNGENMENLSANGSIICLWSEPEIIYDRVKSTGHRPLLNVEDPLKKIKELLDYRRPFYEKADIHIDTTNGNIKEAVDKIKEILNAEKDV